MTANGGRDSDSVESPDRRDQPFRCSIDHLLSPHRLARLLGLSEPPTITALETSGYSGSEFFRIRPADTASKRRFILKISDLKRDWFSVRSGDRWGREARFVSGPLADRVREAVDLPYLAVAVEPGRTGLLMNDLGPWLLPDERSPLDRQHEDWILGALARMHATFWQAAELEDLPWLHSSAQLLDIMGPRPRRRDETGHIPAGGIREASDAGWHAAFELLPPRLRDALWLPAERLAEQLGPLPMTLVHGDTKIANLAILPGQRIAAFDWAFVARAPATFDLGWYLAVNASRLSRSKEAVLARYRELLEKELGRTLEAGLWKALQDAAVVSGAMMLLWNKASAVAQNRPGADQEWRWWIERLEGWLDRQESPEANPSPC